VIMLVIEQMQLIKRWSGYLPMRLLVQIAYRHRVGEELVQLCRHFQPYRLLKFERQHVGYSSIRLDFTGMLVKTGLGAEILASAHLILLLCHGIAPSA